MDAGTEGILPGIPDFRTGPERAGISIEPKAPAPIAELRREQYDTDTALEVFESLLLLAARAPQGDVLSKHPLVLVQAAKGLVGLRSDKPSRRLMEFAIEVCSGIDCEPPDRDRLRVTSDELGEIVSVHELELALWDGDLERAQKQAGRLITVSDNNAMLFDVLLEVAACSPTTAAEMVPFIHYAQRAMDFVGTRNTADFLLPALETVVRNGSKPPAVKTNPRSLAPWEALPYLGNAPAELINLVAHTVQIEADEHVKGVSIRNGLERSLAILVEPQAKAEISEIKSQSGSTADLLAAVKGGDIDRIRGIGRFLGEQGERAWLLEVLEGVEDKQFTLELVLWADSFRMLLRAAPQKYHGLLGELAGNSLNALDHSLIK